MDLSEATKCDLFEKKLDSHVIVVPGLYLKQTRGMETTIALFITTDDIRSLLLFTDCRCLLKSISIADATFDISYGRAWSCFCFAVWNENVGAQDMHKVFIWCYGHIPKGLINIFNFFWKVLDIYHKLILVCQSSRKCSVFFSLPKKRTFRNNASRGRAGSISIWSEQWFISAIRRHVSFLAGCSGSSTRRFLSSSSMQSK